MPPDGKLSDALLHHPAADGHDGPVFLRNRNKYRRTDHSPRSVLPADQRLHSPQLFIACIILGLIVQFKAAAADSILQLVLNLHILQEGI